MTNLLDRRDVRRRPCSPAVGAAAAAATCARANAPAEDRLHRAHLGRAAALAREPDHRGRDMAALGFHGFETFASIVHDWDQKGTLAPLIAQHRIPLVSAYATVQLTDTVDAQGESRAADSVGQGAQEARRPLHGARAQRREARGLQLRRAPRQHRRRPQRVREGDERRRPWRRPASAHQHGRRVTRRDLRGDGGGRHAATASSRPTSASCRRAAPTPRRWSRTSRRSPSTCT